MTFARGRPEPPARQHLGRRPDRRTAAPPGSPAPPRTRACALRSAERIPARRRRSRRCRYTSRGCRGSTRSGRASNAPSARGQQPGQHAVATPAHSRVQTLDRQHDAQLGLLGIGQQQIAIVVDADHVEHRRRSAGPRGRPVRSSGLRRRPACARPRARAGSPSALPGRRARAPRLQRSRCDRGPRPAHRESEDLVARRGMPAAGGGGPTLTQGRLRAAALGTPPPWPAACRGPGACGPPAPSSPSAWPPFGASCGGSRRRLCRAPACRRPWPPASASSCTACSSVRLRVGALGQVALIAPCLT